MSTGSPDHLHHLLQVSKSSLWILILYTFFNYSIHVYSPGTWVDKPLGQNFDVNRKLLPLWPFVASLKKISLNSDFIHIFNVFPHVYRAGADNPLWTKFWYQQKGIVTLPIFCKFEKKYLWRLILYIFLPAFIHVYSPEQGQTTSWGQNFYFNKPFVTLVICCKFLPLND